MDMFDEALAMASALRLPGMTQARLSRELGVSQSYVANKIRLLSLGDSAKEKIREGSLTERHARALLRLTDEEDRLKIIDKVISGGLTVRECEALVDSIADFKVAPTYGVKDKRERINAFIASLKKSLESLSEMGISTGMTRGYYGNKTYITLTVEEDF